MSRAFVKEDDAGQAPIIPPRAALPSGVANYVTPPGLEQLRTELSDLEAERAKTEANREDEAERSRQLVILNGRISALTSRISSAKVIEPKEQPADEVRFGATVTLRTISGGKKGFKRKFTIVGVDEASVEKGLIAFVAPIVKAIQGLKKGEQTNLPMGRGEEVIEVEEVSYDHGKE
ncbi:transcription elongation factor GreB [Pontibacter aydingkolensis]|uniref:GreA/GreB family elongation factor n=1 Tax=Pontibacter aydingkolensis TaxID=1911536 RepID=A0ABS7CX20_9BACT|nr:GreA/GreB family elongation factor [Pontibacter aydingkolensis]MBW7468426.1 GreA/GreB family elongation factor [Pontibacter aydingkolensis]